ncbi:hypothetical protein X777_11005 [Ooceraea biroi]|uniref:Uncharacterized protein n=1 Tax=Ooceraea biroi TaxID=2015173 RepID=A0A026W6K4_OOCBI|nr:hypothetical protein X777_11005 [Ooceraea biroi]
MIILHMLMMSANAHSQSPGNPIIRFNNQSNSHILSSPDDRLNGSQMQSNGGSNRIAHLSAPTSATREAHALQKG